MISSKILDRFSIERSSAFKALRSLASTILPSFFPPPPPKPPVSIDNSHRDDSHPGIHDESLVPAVRGSGEKSSKSDSAIAVAAGADEKPALAGGAGEGEGNTTGAWRERKEAEKMVEGWLRESPSGCTSSRQLLLGMISVATSLYPLPDLFLCIVFSFVPLQQSFSSLDRLAAVSLRSSSKSSRRRISEPYPFKPAESPSNLDVDVDSFSHSRRSLVIDCSQIAKGKSEQAMVTELASETGYWPFFGFLASANGMIDLASVGLIGQKGPSLPPSLSLLALRCLNARLIYLAV
jgi:hypothetical protein